VAAAATNDLQRRLPLFAAIESGQIEVMPVGGGLGPELSRTAEALAVEELILDQPMHGFDIALPSVGFGRDIAMIAAEGSHGGGQTAVLLVF